VTSLLFASALDKTSQNPLFLSRELLKQSQSNLLPVEEQIATIATGTIGYLDSFEIGQVKLFLDWMSYVNTSKILIPRNSIF